MKIPISSLSRGDIVFLKVELEGNNKKFTQFSRSQKEGFSEYGVEHLNKFMVQVISNTRQILKNEYFTSIIDNGYLTDYISYEDLSKAFDNMDEIDLTQAYKTEKWESTFQFQIYIILSRLSLIEKLYKILNEPKNYLPLYHLGGLITYLLMTCCDKLGQPSEFIQFNSWLVSKKESHVNQKRESLNKISDLQIMDPIHIAKELHEAYIAHYSVRNSFYNFFDKCPPELLKSFLSSFNIVKYELPSFIPYSYPDKEKLKFLFENRNSYTHSTFTRFFLPLDFPLGQSTENNIEMSVEQIMRNSESQDYLIEIKISNLFYQNFVHCIKTVLVEDIRKNYLC